MTRAWARAWSAAGGFLPNSAALGAQARAALGLPRRESVGGKRKETGTEKSGYACTARQRSERPKRREVPPRDTCTPLSAPQFTH